jgi:hypothetical protein
MTSVAGPLGCGALALVCLGGLLLWRYFSSPIKRDYLKTQSALLKAGGSPGPIFVESRDETRIFRLKWRRFAA